MNRITLKPGRERSLRNRHPWIFSGAVARVSGEPAQGEICDVYSSSGGFLARGFYTKGTSIAVRILTFREEPVDREFWRDRIRRALMFRRDRILNDRTDCCRLIHGEGDGLPGLTVDLYADRLSLQLTTSGTDRLREVLTEILTEELSPEGIMERSDVPSRKPEGLKEVRGVLAGTVPDRLEIRENGRSFLVDLKEGQKTGFFLDQRENREFIGRMSRGKRVLNCFSYSGGFSVYTAAGGAASTVSVDISDTAAGLCRENLALNGASEQNHMVRCEDAIAFLRSCPEESFDMIILDPPAFTKNRKTVDKAARGYKEINRQACRILPPGGLLYTCSCSQHMDLMLFRKIVHDGGIDAGRDIQLLETRFQGQDHPVSLNHPEGEYLKGLFCRVL